MLLTFGSCAVLYMSDIFGHNSPLSWQGVSKASSPAEKEGMLFSLLLHLYTSAMRLRIPLDLLFTSVSIALLYRGNDNRLQTRSSAARTNLSRRTASSSTLDSILGAFLC